MGSRSWAGTRGDGEVGAQVQPPPSAAQVNPAAARSAAAANLNQSFSSVSAIRWSSAVRSLAGHAVLYSP